MTDDELEAMFRTSLTDHADGVVDSGGRVAAAHAGVRHRRRVTGLVAAAVAAVIIAPVAVVAATSDRGETPASNSVSGSRTWRTESFNGIELKVPSSWTSGVVAWDGCIGQADGHQPYVGRPMGDHSEIPVCIGVLYDAHVWFDSFLPVGSSDNATTVRVDGVTPFNITVSERDPALREAILRSIRPVDRDVNGCAKTPALSIGPSALPPTTTTFTSMSVCLYYKRSIGDRGYLYYSTRIGSAAASRAVSLIEASRWPPNQGQPACGDLLAEGFDRVTLLAHGLEGVREYRIDTHPCGGNIAYRGDGSSHPLTKASARVWAVRGVPLYAGQHPGANQLAPYLPRP